MEIGKNAVIIDKFGHYILSLGTVIKLEKAIGAGSVIYFRDDFFAEKYDLDKIFLAVEMSGLEITTIEPGARLRRAPSVVRDNLLRGIVAAKLGNAHYAP